MDIHIIGKNDSISRKEVKFILEFFGELLLGKRLAKNIFLEVVFETLSKNECGFCTPTDYGYANHRDFEITINKKKSKAIQIRTLAHEMVHVMQFARNQLKMMELNTYKWNGRVMRMSHEKYFDMPWEREAHFSEDYLIQFYKDYCKLRKVKF